MTTSDMKRFQVYAMRLIEKQMIGKGTTHEISKVRQLVVYTGKSLQSFDHYQHKLELYDKRYQVLLEKGLITWLNECNEKQLDKFLHSFLKN